MKLMAVGFPKSGTTSLTKALNKSGVKAAHWRHEKKFVGVQIYKAIFEGRDPFALLPPAVQAVTQADVCLPAHKLNLWPNLDFTVLAKIRQAHPECLFLLNYRNPVTIAESIARWEDFQDRLTVCDVPGLPQGVGGHRDQLITWIENHFDACRRFFANDDHFVEIDIEAPDVAQKLGAALGVRIVGWANHKAQTLEDELAKLGMTELTGDWRDIRK